MNQGLIFTKSILFAFILIFAGCSSPSDSITTPDVPYVPEDLNTWLTFYVMDHNIYNDTQQKVLFTVKNRGERTVSSYSVLMEVKNLADTVVASHSFQVTTAVPTHVATEDSLTVDAQDSAQAPLFTALRMINSLDQIDLTVVPDTVQAASPAS
jgi:hypothetical protein